MKLLASLFLIAALAGGLKGQASKIEFVEYKLDNGLHVILHQDNTTPNVVVEIMYHVGSKNDHPERTGFAHFFEHLLFEGTANIGRGEYSEIVERAGGQLNAGTWFDFTTYFELLPSNQLELGLWLESERMLHPVIDSIGIATQKDVVTEELKQTRDNQPYGRVLAEILRAAFTVHPYINDVGGSADHIRAATEQDIKHFHDTYYVPNNAVLVIAGDIDIEETKRLVYKYFADIPRGRYEIKHPTVIEPIRNQELRTAYYDNIQLPALVLGYPIPAQGTEDYYAVSMLGTLLSQGQSSRMYVSLVDQAQTALAVQAIPLGLEHPGLFIVFGIPNMGVELEVLEAGMNAELERVKNELISERELQKLKNQMESQFVSGNTTISSRASSLARYQTFYKDTNRINTELENYLNVTREDIMRVANKYLNHDRRVVLNYLPLAQE
jgi:predicted Zn-dependent peptidase